MKKKFLGVICSLAMATAVMVPTSASACTGGFSNGFSSGQLQKGWNSQCEKVSDFSSLQSACQKASASASSALTIDVQANITIECTIKISGNINLTSSNGSKLTAGKEFAKGGKCENAGMFCVTKGGNFNMGCQHNVSSEKDFASTGRWGSQGNCWTKEQAEAKCGAQGEVKGNAQTQVEVKDETQGQVQGEAQGQAQGQAQGEVKVDVNAQGSTEANAQAEGNWCFKGDNNFENEWAAGQDWCLKIDGNKCCGSFVKAEEGSKCHISEKCKFENQKEDAKVVEQDKNAEVEAVSDVEVNGKTVAEDSFKSECVTNCSKENTSKDNNTTDEAKKEKTNKNLDNSPKTGDNSMIFGVAGAAVVALGGMATVIVMKKKKKNA